MCMTRFLQVYFPFVVKFLTSELISSFIPNFDTSVKQIFDIDLANQSLKIKVHFLAFVSKFSFLLVASFNSTAEAGKKQEYEQEGEEEATGFGWLFEGWTKASSSSSLREKMNRAKNGAILFVELEPGLTVDQISRMTSDWKANLSTVNVNIEVFILDTERVIIRMKEGALADDVKLFLAEEANVASVKIDGEAAENVDPEVEEQEYKKKEKKEKKQKDKKKSKKGKKNEL